MPDFRIFEETDSGLFQRRRGTFSAPDAERALSDFISSGAPYTRPVGNSRFIVMRDVSGGEPINCHLLKIVAPQGWDVVRDDNASRLREGGRA